MPLNSPRTYGKDRENQEIKAPAGWRILPEGEYVPHVHREFINMPDRKGVWCGPRRTISTMTAIHAKVWGAVHAYAVPEEPQGEIESDSSPQP